MQANNAIITAGELLEMHDKGIIMIKPGSGLQEIGVNTMRCLTQDDIYNYCYVETYSSFEEHYPSYTGAPGLTTQMIQQNQTQQWVSIVDASGVGYSTPPITPDMVNVVSAVVGQNKGCTWNTVGPYHINRHGNSFNFNITKNSNPNLNFTVNVTTGRSDLSPLASYSLTTSQDYSGILYTGQLVNIEVAVPSNGTWQNNGFLHLEIWENNVLILKQFTYVDTSVGIQTSLKFENIRLMPNTNYLVKAYSKTGFKFNGAFSNVTGQHACNLVNTNGYS